MKKNIKLCVIDVDGTMTDGGIYYDNHGNEWKKFCVKDAAGFFVLHELGIKIMVLTGRKCNATECRMKELKVDNCYQNITNKLSFLKKYIVDIGIDFGQIAFIGDDLNDLAVMKMCGYKACPADSCKEIKEIANYVSSKSGGHGAVRDIVENSLISAEQWRSAILKVYQGE